MSVSETPGEKQSGPAIWEKKIHLWADWQRGVVMLGGMEERPLFPFMMLIAYRHPLTEQSALL